MGGKEIKITDGREGWAHGMLSLLVMAWGCVSVASAQDAEAGPGDTYQYYPTQAEEDYLGSETGGEYRRSLGTQMLAPDNRSLRKTGLWYYDQPDENFYENNDWLFRPMENVLWGFVPGQGPFISRTKAGGEQDNPLAVQELSAGAYVDFGLPFTRDFNPDRAHLKLGPFYGDLLRVSANALYSDFQGGDFYDGRFEDDGWLTFIGLTARGLFRLTDHLYISAVGTVYYLPETNRVGFYFNNGNDVNSNLNLRLAWDRQVGEWEFLVFDEFRSYYRIQDLYDEVEVGEIDRAGRYRFGRFDAQENRSTDYFDDEELFFRNDVGVAAYWDDVTDWRLKLAAFRRDIWKSTDFDHTSGVYYGVADLIYDRQDWRLAPIFSYRIRTPDDVSSTRQTAHVGVRGPILQNLDLLARVGYGWSTGTANDQDRFLWDIGLRHRLGPLTSHSINAGQVYSDGEIGDEYEGTFVRYTVHQVLGPRIVARGFTQWANLDNRERDRGLEGELWNVGGSVSWAIGDFSNLTARVIYESTTRDFALTDSDRVIYSLRYSMRLLSRLHGSLLFQYEDFDSELSERDFTEHLYGVSVTRTF